MQPMRIGTSADELKDFVPLSEYSIEIHLEFPVMCVLEEYVDDAHSLEVHTFVEELLESWIEVDFVHLNVCVVKFAFLD